MIRAKNGRIYLNNGGLLKNQGHWRDDIFVVVVHGRDLNVEQRTFLSDACYQIEVILAQEKCESALVKLFYLWTNFIQTLFFIRKI